MTKEIEREIERLHLQVVDEEKLEEWEEKVSKLGLVPRDMLRLRAKAHKVEVLGCVEEVNP